MAEAARAQPTPFADDVSGVEYFDSEAHYRILAANIRDQLRQQGGLALLTGDPMPNSELLARQLTVVGSPRCRAAIVTCAAQTDLANLMSSYRKALGNTIEEAGAVRPASWPPQSPSSRRGQDIDILVLDEAQSLSDEAIEELARVHGAGDGRRPALLLVAETSVIERLAAKPLDQANAAFGARFHLHRLAQREAGAFIRYQLSAADLDQLDIFKPQVVELIETYADGDPVIVNSLARAILKSLPQTPSKFVGVPRAGAPKPEEKSVPDIAAVATLKFPTPEQGIHAHEAPVAALATPNIIPLVEPAANPPQASAPQEVEEPPAPVVEAPSVDPAEAPLEPEPSSLRPADAQIAAQEPGLAEAAATLTPPAETDAPEQEPRPLAAEASPGLAAVVQPLESERGAIEAEALPAAEVDAPASDEERGAVEATPSSEVPSSQSVADYAMEEQAGTSLEFEALPAPTADDAPDDQPISPIDAPSPLPQIEVEAAEQDQAPADAEPAAAVELASPSEEVIETSVAQSNAQGRSAFAAGWLKGLLRIAASFLIVAFVVVAVTVLLGISYDGHTGSSYFDAYLKLARNVGLLPASIGTNTNSTAASVAVPKEPPAQSLRTTTDDASKDLLIGTEPTGTQASAAPKTEKPTMPSVASGATPSPAAPPAPSQPQAGAPPAPAADLTPTPIAAPPAAPVAASPAPAAAPPVPAPVAAAPPSPPVRTPAQKLETAALPAPKEAAPPGADRPTPVGDTDLLLKRGDQLLASGDIIAARHYFELVAEAGDGRAALRLGKTYDPAFLQQSGVRGITGDPAAAKFWYLKAIASGDKDADLRLLQLMALYPER